MFETGPIPPVGQKAIDVFGDRVLLVALPEAVEVGYYLGKLLVNGQREAPKLRRQLLLAGGQFADGLGRKETLVSSIRSRKMIEPPLISRWIGNLADEARSILPVEGYALAKTAGCIDLDRHLTNDVIGARRTPSREIATDLPFSA